MSNQRVSFKELVQKVVNSGRWGKDELSIWGGYCAKEDLLSFLWGWSLNSMPYRIWEYTSEIVFDQNVLPANVALLQRGRLFGEGGDLELRREEAGFRWRFIGPAGIMPPDGDHRAQNYWESHPDVWFHRYEEKVLLWGQWDGQQWHDDRVGAAWLAYPAAGGRLQVHYWVFSRSGQVAFVWYTGLSEWEEDDDA